MARPALTRESILAAALALADEAGVGALTMRRLADELGYEAMSLYRHVANKDDLLGGLVDLVLAETSPPAEGGDWASAVRASAVSVQQALERHPWATGLLMSPTWIRPARLSYMDALLGRLRAAGFSADATYTAYHVLDAHIFGFALWHTNYTSAPIDPEALRRAIEWERYPHLTEHRDQHLTDGVHKDASPFELGLDLILAGLEDLRTAG